MANRDYALTMARYNLWQNESVLAAAGGLSASERQKDRGAFFGSIEATLSHLYWGDQVWLSRFAGTPAPQVGIAGSTALIERWDAFAQARKAFDQQILHWAHTVAGDWFDGDLSWYSGAAGRTINKPKQMLVIQLFNHQTHHRGQIHAMLTAAGAKPDDTDLQFMPERFATL
ncbi:MAG: DinB family protein [Devosiaceae bacterium]|nr:DinB family protein [Devosiaceae bacterium MH13]